MSVASRAWPALACLALAACAGEHDHAHDDEHGHDNHAHGHDEGPPSVGITAWSDTLELYAEHPPAVVGQLLTLAAHVTLLDGFRALDDARVRLTLDGPAHLETEAGMLRSGIYRLELTPTVAGTYRGRLEIIEGGEGSVDGLELVVYPDAEQAAEAVPPEGHAISFLKEQQWRVPFATAFATRGAVRPTVEVPGEIDTPPDGSSHVHAPVAGRVLPGRGGFPVPGREVEHGQELATIALTPASPEQSTRAELDVVEAQARREAAQAELSRMQRLVADQAIPARRVAEAERHLRVSEAAVSAAERARSMYAAASGGRGRGSWRITAPIDGVIDRVDVSPGEAVNANEPLFRIIDASDRWVVAKVPETWAARIHPERDVSFHLLGEETWRPLTGTLVDVSRAVNPTSRTVTVIWSVTGAAPELRVGAAARVAIPVGEPSEGVVVPRSALVDVEGRDVVYVQISGERFEERSVRTGASDGAEVVLLEGVREGERVVTTGGYLVRLASRAGTAVGHGHVH